MLYSYVQQNWLINVLIIRKCYVVSHIRLSILRYVWIECMNGKEFIEHLRLFINNTRTMTKCCNLLNIKTALQHIPAGSTPYHILIIHVLSSCTTVKLAFYPFFTSSLIWAYEYVMLDWALVDCCLRNIMLYVSLWLIFSKTKKKHFTSLLFMFMKRQNDDDNTIILKML